MPTYCYHIIAFFAGFVLDCILGDPYCFPHPVRLIGKMISSLENKYLGPKPPRNEMPETTDEATDETPQKEMTETASEEAITPTASEEVTKKETESSALSPEAKKKREQGRTTVLIVLLCTVAVTDVIFWGSYYLHPILG
ncbi:MAG: hypothetical protein IJU80_06900, partial [Lachnospiraceae bacterium]|nr:hypothetical protein [Lachnospiraceae bacterium]